MVCLILYVEMRAPNITVISRHPSCGQMFQVMAATEEGDEQKKIQVKVDDGSEQEAIYNTKPQDNGDSSDHKRSKAEGGAEMSSAGVAISPAL